METVTFHKRKPKSISIKHLYVSADIYDQIKDISVQCSLGLQSVVDELLSFALDHVEIKDDDES